MNYLNGGYVMIKHNATQTELQNAYKSKKPVIVYDADGKGYFANIKQVGSNYFLTFNKGKIYTMHSVAITAVDDDENSLEFVMIGLCDTNEITLQNIRQYVEDLKITNSEILGNDYLWGTFGSDEGVLYLYYAQSDVIKMRELNISIQSVLDTIL